MKVIQNNNLQQYIYKPNDSINGTNNNKININDINHNKKQRRINVLSYRKVKASQCYLKKSNSTSDIPM